MASLPFRRKTGILVSGAKWLGPQLLVCMRDHEDFNVSRTPKKQATSRLKQKREPQLGQKEARLERESDQGAMRVTAAARLPATLSLGWKLLFRSNFESFDVFKRLAKRSRHFLI